MLCWLGVMMVRAAYPAGTKMLRLLLLGAVLALGAGYVWPQAHKIPVEGASSADWNPESFWHYPWGRSVTHKGIDIFAKEGTPVLAATPGLVVYTGFNEVGGHIVLVLGAKWRVYYYAHLQSVVGHAGQWLKAGEVLGAVGSTGNAHGKPPHLHFSIRSLLPLPWQYRAGKPQARLTMFYVDPDAFLTGG